MGRNSKIQWTHHTANFWWGCVRIAEGCRHCYAEAQSRRWGRAAWGPDRPRQFVRSIWSDLPRWNAAARDAGVRQRVFVSSMSDFFERDALVTNADGDFLYYDDDPTRPTPDAGSGRTLLTIAGLRRAALRLIDQCDWLDFLMLTKRPQNIRPAWLLAADAPSRRRGEGRTVERRNVWLGVSVATQREADALLPIVDYNRDLCAGVFASAEPLVEAIEFRNGEGNRYALPTRGAPNYVPVDWLIVGGESGPAARPCKIRWIADVRRAGAAVGVPVFVKQLGSHAIDDGGRRIALRDGKGGDPDEWPADVVYAVEQQAATLRAFPRGLAGGGLLDVLV